MCAARPAPGRTSAAQMIRPLATIAQVVVERFNYEINIRVQIPVRAALFKLERLRLLDKTIHAHVGAIQFLALPLMQYGCDLLRLAWNQHNRRIIRGVAGTGGRPEDLRRTRPHPGHQMRLPAGVDGLREYARAGGRGLNRAPQTAALRDRLLYRPYPCTRFFCFQHLLTCTGHSHSCTFLLCMASGCSLFKRPASEIMRRLKVD